MKSLRFSAIVTALALVALADGAWGACPSSTVTIPFQTGAVSAGTGTLPDSGGNSWSYSTPAIPSGASFAVPVTLTPASCSTGGSSAFVTGETTLGALRNNFGSPVGFYILVGSAPITVTDLGRMVVSGNTGSHAVSIYDTTCKVLGTATVNTSGVAARTFAYAPLTPNVVLAAGQHYYFMSSETAGGDQWYDLSAGLTSTAAASVVDAAYMQGACILKGSGAGSGIGFPNFKYH